MSPPSCLSTRRRSTLPRSVAAILAGCAALAACGDTTPSASSASGSVTTSTEAAATERSTTTTKDAAATPGQDTEMLPAGPSGRAVNDLGAIDSFGEAGLNIGLAQADGFVVVASPNPSFGASDPTSMPSTDFWSLNLKTSKSTPIGSTTGLAYNLAASNGIVFAPMRQCVGNGATERGCFASLTAPTFAVEPVDGTGPAGIYGQISSGHDAYVLAQTGPQDKPTLSITKASIDDTLAAASWPTVTMPARAGSSWDQQIVGISTLTPTTSSVLTKDGARWTIDWNTAKVAEAGTIPTDEDNATLCGAGGNTVLLSYVEGDDWTEAGLKVERESGSGGWKQIIKPKGGTNLGAEPLECAATKTGIWIVQSGELFELDATDGHLIKRYDLRPKGSEDGGGIQPRLSISDEAVVVFTNDHLYTLT